MKNDRSMQPCATRSRLLLQSTRGATNVYGLRRGSAFFLSGMHPLPQNSLTNPCSSLKPPTHHPYIAPKPPTHQPASAPATGAASPQKTPPARAPGPTSTSAAHFPRQTNRIPHRETSLYCAKFRTLNVPKNLIFNGNTASRPPAI